MTVKSAFLCPTVPGFGSSIHFFVLLHGSGHGSVLLQFLTTVPRVSVSGNVTVVKTSDRLLVLFVLSTQTAYVY